MFSPRRCLRSHSAATTVANNLVKLSITSVWNSCFSVPRAAHLAEHGIKVESTVVGAKVCTTGARQLRRILGQGGATFGVDIERAGGVQGCPCLPTTGLAVDDDRRLSWA